jgi:hypothetical protein
MRSRFSPIVRRVAVACVAIGTLSLGGCAVVAVVDTTASIAVGAVGLAADAAIGTARIAGKVVGAAADAVIPDGEK